MFILIIGIIILSFFEATWLPFSLIVLVLIIRSFVIPDKFNYFLAFGFGLLLSILTNQTVGFLSLIFLILVKVVQIIRISQLASSWFFILPISFALLILFSLIESLTGHSSFSLGSIMLQMILVLPIYLVLRFWEERFTPQKEVRLKVKS